MEIEFLKDFKWKIGMEIKKFKKCEHADIPDKTAQEMIDKKYGESYHDIEEEDVEIQVDEDRSKKEDAKRQKKEASNRKKKEKEEAKRNKKEIHDNKNKQKDGSIHTKKNGFEIPKA